MTVPAIPKTRRSQSAWNTGSSGSISTASRRFVPPRSWTHSAMGRTLRPQPHRHRLGLVDEPRLGEWHGAGELHLREALERLLDHDPQLEPRQRGAEAEVTAARAERLVLGIT